MQLLDAADRIDSTGTCTGREESHPLNCSLIVSWRMWPIAGRPFDRGIVIQSEAMNLRAKRMSAELTAMLAASRYRPLRDAAARCG